MSQMQDTVVGVAVEYRISNSAKRLRIKVSRSGIAVSVPVGYSVSAARKVLVSKREWIEKSLHKIKRRALENEKKRAEMPRIDLDKAQEELFERLSSLAERFGLSYGKATFRCQKTKWGSCSAKNNISLNVNMVFLPPHLQDYLLLHELAHTVEKNHGPKYWKLLSFFTGCNAKELDAELSRHRIMFDCEQLAAYYASCAK
ncbi:MAG: M48 family metallopeptidase [Phycisphaerae bacterium]